MRSAAAQPTGRGLHSAGAWTSTLARRHGIDVDPHLDRDADIPVLTGPQAQGDVATDLLSLPVAGVPTAGRGFW